MAAGTAETERQVERVVLRIHPSPEPPHGATADFELVHLAAGQEVLRERWSLSLRFEFLETRSRPNWSSTTRWASSSLTSRPTGRW